MKIYIVYRIIEYPYCSDSNEVVAVFATEESANKYIKDIKPARKTTYDIEEFDLLE